MKPNRPTKRPLSLYSLLVRSEEKARPLLETAAYALIALCAVAAILQFAQQPDPLPLTSLPGSVPPSPP